MKTRLVLPLVVVFLLVGCGKSVDLGDLDAREPQLEPDETPPNSPIPSPSPVPSMEPNPSSRPSPLPSPTPPQGACADPVRWDFVQPQPTVNRAVDLLFVVDTSASLEEERKRLARTIPDFLNKISPQSDLRIAVMPGHGGASTLSGRLFAASGRPLVLDSKTMTVGQLQSNLEMTLKQSPSDPDVHSNGEALMYSLTRSLEAARVQEIRSHGFYRPNAALSVVFLTDENDLCFDPEANGYTEFPDFVRSYRDYEKIGFQRYCSGVSVDSTHRALRNFKGDRKLSLGGITHVTPSLVPKKGEDAIGHGIIELVRSELNGVLFDVSKSSYVAGLTQLANVVSTQLDLLLSFKLDGPKALDPASVRVWVDGQAVTSRYESSSRTVHILAENAGSAGSRVEVRACPILSQPN